ncbi:MAG: hypothetical protein J6A97_07205 [Clostridia bacterium]|nr:hypothetical protein [Clostridia bacterium]
MLLKILTALIAIGVIALTYPFVKAQKDGACPKSLLIKMAGATGYMAVGALCIFMTGECSEFDKAMMLALLLSWLGDLFLHLWFHFACTAVGFTCFLASHILFIRAYITGINFLTASVPEKFFYSVPEIILIVVLVGLFIYLIEKSDMNLHGFMRIPIIIYGIVILTMLCKAAILSIEAVKFGISPLAALCGILGALSFVASDFSISILMFDRRHKKNFKLKLFNMYTYFIAEILLASLIFFI